MKLLKVFLGLSVLTSLQASSLIKVECDVSGEEIYLDGKFKTECESGELVKLLAPAGKHTLKAVKHNRDGSYYKFVKTFRLGDGVEKVISVNSKINYTEKYYYKKAFDSLKDAKVYLEKYPNGKYVKEIKNYWDKKYFSKCDTIYGCQDYLNNISWGKYKTSAKNRIEKYYFQRSNDINGCKTYLEKYPNGKYAKKIRKKLEKIYYERAKNDIDYAKEYLNKYPKGVYVQNIKNFIEEIESKKAIQNPDYVYNFIMKYPNSKYILTIQKLYANKCETDINMCNFYKTIFPDGKYIKKINTQLDKFEKEYFKECIVDQDDKKCFLYIKNNLSPIYLPLVKNGSHNFNGIEILKVNNLKLINNYDGDPNRTINYEISVKSNIYKLIIIKKVKIIPQGSNSKSSTSIEDNNGNRIEIIYNKYFYRGNSISHKILSDNYNKFFIVNWFGDDYKLSNILEPIWNKWFYEKIIIDFNTHTLKYLISTDNKFKNSKIIKMNNIHLKKGDLVLGFGAWDWAAGTQQIIQDLKVYEK